MILMISATTSRLTPVVTHANAVVETISYRVVRGNHDLAGYRWGIERKRELIRKEAMP